MTVSKKNIEKTLKELTKSKRDRFLKTLGENSINTNMTRKVDTYEYESLAECIRTDQVPASEIAEIFTDKTYYKWYKKKYLTK
jgi:hypothetical protein|tara:strand:+ start:4850 stop:5098 length:249 start_codon:yes stop_codon:yes gene_type:complete